MTKDKVSHRERIKVPRPSTVSRFYPAARSFDRTRVRRAQGSLGEPRHGEQARELHGHALPHTVSAKQDPQEERLAHGSEFSDDLSDHGTGLVQSLIEQLPARVAITGGWPGDDARPGETLVFTGDVTERSAVDRIFDPSSRPTKSVGVRKGSRLRASSTACGHVAVRDLVRQRHHIFHFSAN